MKRENFLHVMVVAAVLFCVLGAFWYVEAGNFDDAIVQGVYVENGGGETWTLTLRSDHSFIQILDTGGRRTEAQGTWRLFPSDSQSHIAFSSEFLTMPGQMKSADGIAYGSLRNNFGLLTISLNSRSLGVTLHKKWLTAR